MGSTRVGRSGGHHVIGWVGVGVGVGCMAAPSRGWGGVRGDFGGVERR